MYLKGGVIVFILSLFGFIVRAQKVSFVQKNVSLVKLFKEIRKQTGVTVVWNEAELNVNQKIDAVFRDAELKAVMDDIAVRLPITYTFLGKIIVVKEKLIAKVPDITEKQPSKNGSAVLQSDREVNLKEVEIVSTGYQRIPKERAAGSFVLVDSAQLNRRVSTDIFTRLEGIASGLLFNKSISSSNLGGLNLSIRGRSTIYANDQPLVILDDFPFNGDFNAINPNDVANVTLLKDAAAASIWGVRAGNGVIVITTKRGKDNQPLNLTFNSNLTVSGKPDIFYNPNFISSSDFIDIETFLFKNGKYDAALADQVNYPVVSPVVQILDKQRKGESTSETERKLNALREKDVRNEQLKYLYRNSMAQQYFLNISKGLEKSNHYLSAGYDRVLSTLINNKDNRFTLNTQHTFRLLKRLELTAGISYTGNNGTTDSTLLLNSIRNFVPYYQFKDENGEPTIFERKYSSAFNSQLMSKGFLDWSYVPLNELMQPPTRLNINLTRFNAGIKYTILPGLSTELKYLRQYTNITTELISGMNSYVTRDLINIYSKLTAGQVSGYNIPIGSIQYQTRRKEESEYFRVQVNYQKEWSRHSVSALVGYELSQFETQADRYTRYAYDVHTGGSAMVDTASTFNLYPSGTSKINSSFNLYGKLDRVRSVFANASYVYDGKYVISGSARFDGSNYFGVKTNNRNVPLWSAGTLWHIDKENFYGINWLPVLKMRFSYGYNGNLDKNSTGITTFRYNPSNAALTGLSYANIINIGNPELRWEKIGIANFGVDFGLKNRLISGSAEYYFKKGIDILGDKAFASSTGIKVLRGNYSEMKAHGFDLSVISRNLNSILKWQSQFLFSYAQDKVSLYDVIEPNNIYYVGRFHNTPLLGKPVFGIYSYKWAGLDPVNGDPRGYLNGEISKDYNRILNETSVADLEFNGPARPTIFGALNNTFSFQRFTLGFNLSYKLGYYFRKASVNYYNMYYFGLGESMNRDFAQRWQKAGDEYKTNIPSMGQYVPDDKRDRFYNGSSATVAKGDHIRLQDVSLSFDLNTGKIKKNHVKQMQVYLYVTNLGILWKANDFGLDPDVIPSEGVSAPLPKSFSIGIKASF